MADSEADLIVRRVLAERIKLLALIRSIVGRRDVAEEIFQDVCLLVLQKRHEIADSVYFQAWLRTATRHLAMNAKRKAVSEATLLGDEIHELLEPEWRRLDEKSSIPLGDALEVCVGRLKPREQELLVARYTEGLGFEELAHRVNRPVGTLYTTMARIHKKLSDCVRRRLTALERRHA